MRRTSLYSVGWWTLKLLLVGLFIVALLPRYRELSAPCSAEHQHRDCGFYVLTGN